MSDQQIKMPTEIAPPKLGDDDQPKKRKAGRPKGSTTKNTSAKNTSPPKVDAPPKPVAGAKFAGSRVMREGIKGIYETAGMGLAMAPQLMPVGMQCVQQAEAIADAWVDAAEQSPAIRKFWEQILTTSVYSKLFMAHAPILMVAVGPRIGAIFGGGGADGPATAQAPPSPASPFTAPPADEFFTPDDLAGFNPAFDGSTPNGTGSEQ